MPGLTFARVTSGGAPPSPHLPPRRRTRPRRRRCTLLIFAALLDGPRRFNELQDELDGIAPNVLSARLKFLTEQALIIAAPYSDRPPRFVYQLAEPGRELAGALRLLADWGARTGGGEPYRHEPCGTALEARWWCPSCEEIVDDPGDEVVNV